MRRFQEGANIPGAHPEVEKFDEALGHLGQFADLKLVERHVL